MVSTREIGELGEKLAQQFLRKLGYKILATNWYYGHLELDIVAQDGNELVIVEVKSRSGIRYEHPAEAITNAKIKRVVEAADGYIQEMDIEIETRFDVISQTLKTHQSVDNQLINSFSVFLNLQANKYLSEKACRYGWKTGQDTSTKYF